ncbi:hypothetical protein TREES_T100009753 [Tupaia chinensis]|uniref:Uncharacterized protein n=1 Tax=Tupaia chinensis TaxID=246437 RepID=L9KS37_TUPCH|nr:hypothetical protein TREES_T100009754 [Tupaia chinensis]ELW65765.1 hypothetical protein TREES_T100009753 [Tupaia chinensis]
MKVVVKEVYVKVDLIRWSYELNRGRGNKQDAQEIVGKEHGSDQNEEKTVGLRQMCWLQLDLVLRELLTKLRKEYNEDINLALTQIVYHFL